jgi:hypothetical protein
VNKNNRGIMKILKIIFRIFKFKFLEFIEQEKNELKKIFFVSYFYTNKKVEYRNKDTVSFMISNFFVVIILYSYDFVARLNNKFYK